MYKFTKDGISVLIVLDRRRKKANGLYPVKIEVVHRRIQRYYPTGKDLSEAEWEALWRKRQRTMVRASIENSFYIIKDRVEGLAEKGAFSFHALELRMGTSAETVNTAIEEKMNELMDCGRINSYYRYRSTLRALERFAGKHISYMEISPKWLKECESYWAKGGLSQTSVNIYMKTLKSILHRGLTEDTKSYRFPFGQGRYEIPPCRPRMMAMTKEQIRLIASYRGAPMKEYYRDLWMFSYMCNGINFRDMLFLKYRNIRNGEIIFRRTKTMKASKEARTIKAYITPQMAAIIEKWGNSFTGNPDTYIFRHAKGGESAMEVTRTVRNVISRCNNTLKGIACELEIPAFTTYSARHSFATILKRGGTDIKYISESLGHTSISMTEHYLDGFEREDRVRYSKILTDF